MPGSREQTFFARLLGEEGVAVLEGGRLEEGEGVIGVVQVAGGQAGAAQGAGTGTRGPIEVTLHTYCFAARHITVST